MTEMDITNLFGIRIRKKILKFVLAGIVLLVAPLLLITAYCRISTARGECWGWHSDPSYFYLMASLSVADGKAWAARPRSQDSVFYSGLWVANQWL